MSDPTGPTMLVMACRPTDPNDYPEEVRPLLIDMMKNAPLEPGFLDTTCQLCGMNIQMGPRQRSQWELDPERFVVVDLLCAVKVGPGLPTSITSLGGK